MPGHIGDVVVGFEGAKGFKRLRVPPFDVAPFDYAQGLRQGLRPGGGRPLRVEDAIVLLLISTRESVVIESPISLTFSRFIRVWFGDSPETPVKKCIALYYRGRRVKVLDVF
jgi:hypothetical protein